jgi:hypothetical protein
VWYDPWNWGALTASFCVVGGELVTRPDDGRHGEIAPTLRVAVDYTSDTPPPTTYDWYTYTSCSAELRLGQRADVFGEDALEGMAYAWDRTYPTSVACSEPEVEAEFVAALAGAPTWAVAAVRPEVGEPCASGNCYDYVHGAFRVPVTRPKTVWAQGRATAFADGSGTSADAVAAGAAVCLSISGGFEPPDE